LVTKIDLHHDARSEKHKNLLLRSSYLLRQSKISLTFIKLVDQSNVSETSLKNKIFGTILCGVFSKPATVVGRDVAQRITTAFVTS
jgi:hypothetical protein